MPSKTSRHHSPSLGNQKISRKFNPLAEQYWDIETLTAKEIDDLEQYDAHYLRNRLYRRRQVAINMLQRFEGQISYLNHQLILLQEKEEKEKSDQPSSSSSTSNALSPVQRKRLVILERLNHFHRKKDKFLKFIHQTEMELTELYVVKANRIHEWECNL